MSEEEFCSVNCCECGITFKFTKTIEKMWRDSGKNFFCPNGHTLHWSKPVETEDQKELKKLKVELASLKEKLAAAEKKATDQKKLADDLAAELEIWRPSTSSNEDQKVG